MASGKKASAHKLKLDGGLQVVDLLVHVVGEDKREGLV